MQTIFRSTEETLFYIFENFIQSALNSDFWAVSRCWCKNEIFTQQQAQIKKFLTLEENFNPKFSHSIKVTFHRV